VGPFYKFHGSLWVACLFCFSGHGEGFLHPLLWSNWENKCYFLHRHGTTVGFPVFQFDTGELSLYVTLYFSSADTGELSLYVTLYFSSAFVHAFVHYTQDI
jgi:hypothetical protein